MNKRGVSVESMVRGQFEKLMPAEGAINDDTPLADLGIDSLDFFEALLILEEEHGISIPIAGLDEQVTLGDILALAVARG